MRLKVSLLVLMVIVLSNLQAQQEGWMIEAKEIDPSNYYGITVANGMVGLVSSPEPMKVKDVVLNGVYDNYQRGRVSNILKTFNHINMDLDVDGRRVGRRDIQNYAQVLDMKKAILTTTYEVGEKVSVEHQLMSLRHLPFTAMSIVKITAKKDVTITPYSVIESPDHLVDVKNVYAEIDRPHILIPLMSSAGKSPTGKLTVAASTSFIFPEGHGEEPDVIHEDWDFNRHLMKFYKKLKAGETYEFAVVGSTISSGHSTDAFNEAERLTIFAKLEGIDRLLNRHLLAWEDLWHSDIIIEGDPASQLAVRSALYHLYSFAREGSGLSLSPMGLSGLGYNGHVFWDTELWMYPPLLMLQPGMSKSLLDYRFDRMEAARMNAFMHGYDGVMFPWESSADGSEDTPVWALTGPFQHHITGCIGWSYWKYYEMTKDKVWLKEKGYPLLKEVADFWASRVERNGPGKYEIKNVIGANEWQENIDNNAFTNGMAKTVLAYATLAAQEIGEEPNKDWMHVAQNIPILKFSNGVTKENATYAGEEIKQADVNLLSFPLNVVHLEAEIKKDLEYYATRMSPEGPAMGQSVLATLYARLGEPEKAYEYFLKSWQPNEVPPFGVLAETAGGTNPYFATGAGGMLQAVIFGFGGLQLDGAGVSQLQTKLPAKWKSLTIKGVGENKEVYKVRN